MLRTVSPQSYADVPVFRRFLHHADMSAISGTAHSVLAFRRPLSKSTHAAQILAHDGRGSEPTLHQIRKPHIRSRGSKLQQLQEKEQHTAVLTGLESIRADDRSSTTSLVRE